MSVIRVHSSDTQIFVNDIRLSGVQSVEFATTKNSINLPSLGRYNTQDKILTSNQTSTVSFIYHLIADNSAFDPFFSVADDGILSVESFNLKVLDNAGQNLINSAYLSRYQLNFALNQICYAAISYEADSIDFNQDDYLAPNEQSNDDYSVYKPSEITVTSSSFDEGIGSSDFCIQNANIEFSISRTPVNILGQRTPTHRYPQFPIEGSVSFQILKNQITGLNLSPLVLNKGDLTFNLSKFDNNSIAYTLNDCSLISVNESNDLDGNAIIDFSYTFPLTNNSFSRQVIPPL